MLQSNKLTVHFQKRETCLKWIIGAFVYFLLFGFIENPCTTTISLIGKSHMWLFAVFCTVLPVAFLSNFKYTFRVYNVKAKFLRVAMYFNLIFGLSVTTLMPKEGLEISTFATVAHWVSGFGNIIANTVIALVLLLKVSKITGSKLQKGVAISAAVIAALDGLIFVGSAAVLKNPQLAKNGLFEIIPMAMAFVAIYFTNHVDAGKFTRAVRDAEENCLRPVDNSSFTAVAYAVFAVVTLFFSTYIFVRNPIYYTISMIGIQYRTSYSILCVLLVVSFLVNFILIFKKYNYKNIAVWILGIVGSLSLLLCVVQPTSEEADSIGKFHAIGALTFFYFSMFAVLIFAFLKRKDGKVFRNIAIGMFVTLVICTALCVLEFVVLKGNFGETGRTGLTEVVSVGYILYAFYKLNYSKISLKEA